MARHTKADTHTDTNGAYALSPQQETAVDLLASGRNVTDTAEALEVARQTVSEWLHHHPGFQAALHKRRRELWDGMTDRLRTLLPKALDVLGAELEGDNPLPAAVHVLKACGLYGMTPPREPVEAEDLDLEARRQQQVRRQQAMFLG